jgi:hypothetical protein
MHSNHRSAFKIIFIMFAALLLTSCSSVKQKEELKPEDDKREIVQETTVEAENREPIYVYRKEQEQNLKEVTLRMNSQPILLPVRRSLDEGGASGYVRLVGVVSGGRPIALVEVGGRGLCVGIGEEVGGYRSGWHSKRKGYIEKNKPLDSSRPACRPPATQCGQGGQVNRDSLGARRDNHGKKFDCMFHCFPVPRCCKCG